MEVDVFQSYFGPVLGMCVAADKKLMNPYTDMVPTFLGSTS